MVGPAQTRFPVIVLKYSSQWAVIELAVTSPHFASLHHIHTCAGSGQYIHVQICTHMYKYTQTCTYVHKEKHTTETYIHAYNTHEHVQTCSPLIKDPCMFPYCWHKGFPMDRHWLRGDICVCLRGGRRRRENSEV